MDKRQILKQDFTSQVRREIYIMRSLKHKHIVRMHEVLSSESKLYIVMDFVRGGELFHHLEKYGRVDESDARKYFQQLVDGVDFCHKSGVAHRDLKPENILLDENGDIRITDFGFSSMRGVDVNADLLHTQCGTPDYCAPEIIECSSKGYSGAKVDAWSCGIILFALLAGRLPFVEQDTEKLYDLILACQVQYPNCISPQARDLLQHLLVRDPAKRFDLQAVKHHPWFLQDYEGDDARMLKKRPFFNKNNQKNLASAPTTPAVPENSNGTVMGGGVTLPTEASISNKADVGLAVKTDPTPERLPADPDRQFFTKSVHMSDIKTPTTPSMSGNANGHGTININGNTTLSAIPTVVPAAREPSPSPQKGPEPFKPFPGKALINEPEPIGPSDHFNHQDHELDDNASDGGDSVEDYTEKPVPELTLPIEPLSLNRSRPAQSERPRSQAVYPPLSVSRSQQPIRIQKNNEQPMAQRHRSDVTENTASRQYMHVGESVSLSSLPGPRRAVPPNIVNGSTGNTTTSARDHRQFRHVRAADTNPNSPHFAAISNGSPGLVPRPLSINGTPDYGPGSYGKAGGSSRMAPYSTPSSSKGNMNNGTMLQTEVTARHIWSIVNKWRGTSDPVSPSSSMDILSDFRVLTSEVGNLRADEKGVVLDRFLALFEAFGLADMQNRHSVMNAIQHQNHNSQRRGQIENDLDDDSTYDEVGNTAGDSRQHSVQSGQRRPPTDISSEEETLSWSPVHPDSQNRQQSDLARRREMSDLLNRWILKTGGSAGNGSASGPPINATRSASTPVQGLDDDPIPSSLDIQELHRLMKQHHGGREESNLADELYKLVHAEHGGDAESSVFSHGASPSSMRSADASTLSQSLNRWHIGPHAGLAKNRPLRPPSSSHGRLRSDYSHTRYGDSQGTLPSVHNDGQSSASVGNSSDNNSASYAAMMRENMIGNGNGNGNRNRQHGNNPGGPGLNMVNMTPNMATSMNLQDVEYYGPERKNGMAMKFRSALLTIKVRNQKLAENLTQFNSNLPAQDIIRIMVGILQNVGGIVTLKKETKRKLKCRIHRHDDYYLCAAIDFQTDNAGSTTVVFKRSKEDRGRTDIASFHEFYEKVRELFLKEVHHRYDRNGSRANGNGAPKRRRSPRYIGGSFG